MTSPVVEQSDLQGVIGEKAKIQPAMVIEVIRIDLNQSNKTFYIQQIVSTERSQTPSATASNRSCRGSEIQKSEKEVCNRRACKCCQFEPIESTTYMSGMRSEVG